MLHGAVLRAPCPRARILALDLEEARRLPGVVLVLTAEDVPGQRFQGHIVPDWPAMAGGNVPDMQ
jgi:xanthine dehydrogenase molybdenum-binding subunit